MQRFLAVVFVLLGFPALSIAQDSVLAWLLDGKVFQTKTADLKIAGDLQELPFGSENRDIFWTCVMAGGSQPKFHRYFMFRAATDRRRDAFEIVFFNDNADGFSIPVLLTAITRNDAGEIHYTYSAYGGGSGESLKSKRDYTLATKPGGANGRILAATISEEVTRYKAWHFFSHPKFRWRADMQFAPVEVPAALVMAAQKISTDVGQQNQREEELARARRKKR